MKIPQFGETPKERAIYILWACNNDLNTCNKLCDKMIAADITPSFYDKFKIELKNNENKFGESKLIVKFVPYWSCSQLRD